MQWNDDMGSLGEYFAEFSHGDLAAATKQKLDLGDEVPVLVVQRHLNRQGVKGANKKVLVEDGKWGNNTDFALRAWINVYNRTNNAAASFENFGVNKLLIFGGAGKIILAAAKIQGAPSTPAPVARAASRPAPVAKAPKAAKAAVPKPTEPSKQGMVQAPVARVQAILKSSGLKLAVDGAWGPTTQRLWQALAGKRSVDPTINRAGPDSAWVMPQTLTALGTPAAVAAAPPAAPAQAASATITTRVGALQKIIVARGTRVAVDGKYGPRTAAAWSALATARGLSPAISRSTGTTAKVAKATYDALLSPPSVPASTGTVPVTKPVPVPTPSVPSVPTSPIAPPPVAAPSHPAGTVAVMIPVIQKAWVMVLRKKPDAGAPVAVDGAWNDGTIAALVKMVGLPPVLIAKRVNRGQTAVYIESRNAELLGMLAQQYDDRVLAEKVVPAAPQQQQQGTPTPLPQPKPLRRSSRRVRTAPQPGPEQQQSQTFAPVVPDPFPDMAPMQEQEQAPAPAPVPQGAQAQEEATAITQASSGGGSGSSVGLIVGGLALVACLAYFMSKKKP